MSSAFSLFCHQVLEKLDLEVLDFGLFSSFAILEWFRNFHFKHAIIPVCVYFERNIWGAARIITYWTPPKTFL